MPTDALIQQCVAVVPHPMIALTPTFIVQSVNTVFCQVFGVQTEDAIGKSIFDLGSGWDQTPDLRRLLEEHLPQKGAVVDFPVLLPIPEAGHQQHTVHGQQVRDADDGVSAILLAINRTEPSPSRREEERFRRIVEATNEGIWQVDAEGITTFVNDEMAQMLGFTVEEMLGRPPLPMLAGESQQFIQQKMEARRIGVRERYELTFLKKTGEEMHALVSAVPFVSKEGTFSGSLAMVTDITERKQAEAALLESEQLHRAVLSNISDAVFITRLDGTFTYICPNVTNIFGYTHAEVMAMGSIHALFDSNRLPNRVFEGREELRNFELGVLDKQSQWHHLLINVRRVRIGTGTLLFTARDISERKKAEAALQEEEERLQFALDASNMGVWEFYPVQEEVIWSAQAERLFGLKPGAFDGTLAEVKALLHPADQSSFEEKLEGALRQQEPYQLEFRVLHPSGRVRWLVSRGKTEFDGEGHAIRLAGVVVDITERKHAEQQIREAKEQAEEVSRLKTALLANMSHEVRTPLTAIIGFAELLWESVDGEASEMAAMVHEGGVRLHRTLNSVLELAQLESSTRPLQHEWYNISEIAHTTAQLFHHEAHQKGLALHVDIPATPVRANIDRGALERVFHNLVSNAIKFTRHGQVVIGVKTTPAGVEIWVADTGIGISDTFLEKLYEPFTQESAGFSRDYEGIGLGLTITRQLVSLLGGSLSVQTQKGQGSIFTVRIPPPEAGVQTRAV